MRVKLLALVLVVLVATGIGSREAATARAAASISEVCARIPEFGQAIIYTNERFPVADNVQRVGMDLTTKFTYFTLLIAAADQNFCKTFAGQPVPDIVARTAMWNFGNASVALAEYQRAVGMTQ